MTMRLVVGLTPDADAASVQRAVADTLEKVLPGGQAEVTTDPYLPDVLILRLATDSADDGLLAALGDIPGVRYAQRERFVEGFGSG